MRSGFLACKLRLSIQLPTEYSLEYSTSFQQTAAFTCAKPVRLLPLQLIVLVFVTAVGTVPPRRPTAPSATRAVQSAHTVPVQSPPSLVCPPGSPATQPCTQPAPQPLAILTRVCFKPRCSSSSRFPSISTPQQKPAPHQQ